MKNKRYILFTRPIVISLVGTLFFFLIPATRAYIPNISPRYRQNALPGFKTNTAKRIIELDELQTDGPGKDDIPSITKPRFVNNRKARTWLKPNEPVISLVHRRTAKAYPLQILIWHEIVNDEIGGEPIAVTFCPLCYSAAVFNRRVSGRKYIFGVSGMLRNSDMVMYDRETETLWQQLTGQSIVGDLVPAALTRLPSQIISFAQFARAYPNGLVLSQKTGHRRDYGRNPYSGYDDINNTPFLYKGQIDPRLKPMEKIVAVTIGGESIAYPYSITIQKHVINDQIAGTPIVIFHDLGAVSALDQSTIALSRQAGSTGVFSSYLQGRLLTFDYNGTTFFDLQTKSTWLITGQATDGPLKGKTLTPLPHGNYFAFAYLAFKPKTKIYEE
ncbi:MAG: DUF3179 domain-containing protein [Planctomycetota bacterium]|jgi:hypothetical protein